MVYSANPISKEQLQRALNALLEESGLPTDEDALIAMIEEHSGGDFNEQMTEWIDNEFWSSELYNIINTLYVRWNYAAGTTTSVLSPILSPFEILNGSANSASYDLFSDSVTASPAIGYSDYALGVTQLAIKPDGTLTFNRQWKVGRYSFSGLIEQIKNSEFVHYTASITENYPVLAWFIETDGQMTTTTNFTAVLEISTGR